MEFGSGRGLALVIDDEPDSRRETRRLLGALGFDVVHAATGLVGLELVQRLPESFALVLTDLTLRGVPGAVVVEALRLFRPELPVLCMGRARAVGVPALPQRCLAKPLQAAELRARVEAVLNGVPNEGELSSQPLSGEVVARAREQYAAGRGLVEAALELARGYSEH
ncbi:MAG TPA: response regulator [Gemmatimonadales bacterium]|nr:response regulator [Gemmatimonadales bacterium]